MIFAQRLALAALALVLVLALVPAASSAGVVGDRFLCRGHVEVGGERYNVREKALRCPNAKQKAAMVIRSEGERQPRGYDCRTSSGWVDAVCRRSKNPRKRSFSYDLQIRD